MHRPVRWNALVGSLLSVFVMALIAIGVYSCGTAPTPFMVSGPGQFGNDPPTLTILEPATNITRGQGDPFLIGWTDSDRDNNAMISFLLVETQTNTTVLLVDGLEENDLTGPDSFTVSTDLIPVGNFNILGIIDDGVNDPIEVFAMTQDAASPQRIEVKIVGEGEGQQTQPPTISVAQPQFNLSVSQDDILTVVVQPSELNQGIPFDPDSNLTLFILLDLDLDPNNDDPANPDPSQIIVLEQTTIAAGSTDPVEFNITIDLDTVPPRSSGEPYFIRATADDATNPRVHQYAVGNISVVQLAAGLVDLFDIGRTKSGALFKGFNPGANVGSDIAGVSDFDVDGVADFVIVAQFGNPRNLGPVGEAYLIYGLDGTRFGGVIPVNSISETVSGVIFEAPPIRSNVIRSGDPRSDGISNVSWVRDLSGDGRPELLFGLPHVHGAFEGMDFDPSDDDITGSDTTVQLEVALRQGEVTVQEGQDDPEVFSQSYAGVEEVTISSADPSASRGSDSDISWRDAGAGNREWTLIKFVDVLRELPDNPASIDFDTINASLELRIFDTGGNGSLREAFTDFSEQTRFNTYALNGGEPQEGVDYSANVISSVNGAETGTITPDISDQIRLLLDGQFSSIGNELRFIIVPGTTDAEDGTSARSSEFSIEADRPILRITYSRQGLTGRLGCYPDPLVNNATDTNQADPFDVQFTGGGMALVVNSENRDNNPRLSPIPQRLDASVVTLELVGQESGPGVGGWILGGDGINQSGNILPRVDDFNDIARIAGARFMAGPFDFEDHRLLSQPPREDLFGQNVTSIGDLNNDGLDEIIISAPLNERHVEDLFNNFGFQSTHWQSTVFKGSIIVIPGTDYNTARWREINSDTNGSSSIPTLDQQIHAPFGNCTAPLRPRHLDTPADTFQVFAEDIDDMLGGASSAGDFNQDGIDDILCGAYLNDRTGLLDSGAAYVLYGRNILGNFDLKNADDPILRAPMLRIRGLNRGDRIGWRQTTGQDVNGDRIADVFISSPTADFGGVTRATCAAEFNGSSNPSRSSFNSCQNSFGEEVFTNDSCSAFDYDKDGDIDDDDECIFCCLSSECEPADDCVLGTSGDCCADMVDNGFVGIIFGGVSTDGDRDISQIATTDLPGTVFYGAASGHRAGMDVSSAGDFNQDGFGDLLIATPGETRLDDAGRERLGVVYLIFGGTHLHNTSWSLASVGSEELPGIVFLSPYVKGRPNEAGPSTVAFLGDINNDGFGDIAIGNPQADFIDTSFPQGPGAPGTDASVGRRRNAGDAYIIYGNNFGSNRPTP